MRKDVFFVLIGTLFITSTLSCGKETEIQGKPEHVMFIDIVRRGESDIFTVAFDRYTRDTSDLPIGVFDSGIGGLTVLAEIISEAVMESISETMPGVWERLARFSTESPRCSDLPGRARITFTE